jgi:NitT/TauT family transport system permease protein
MLDTAHAGSTPASRPLVVPPVLRIALLQIALLALLLAAWELAIRFGWIAVYLYGQPSGVFSKAATLLANGELLRDAALTAWEAIAGFLIGTLLGSTIGLMLWLIPTGAAVLRPYLIALNGLPKIALAPLIIVWFGIGISSKIAIAAIITFIVAIIAAQQGAKEVDADLVKLMRSLGASRWKTWRTVVIPGAMPWIVSAFRLNVGFALIGAVVGEYIASKSGLGYMIYYAGVLYDLNAVWVGIAALMIVALLMYGAIDLLERRLRY